MSEIAEKKALETYPEAEGSETYFDRDYICTKPIDLNRQRREGYVKGYDQAMQDFLEWLKDCSTFTYSNGYKRIDYDLYNKLVEDFKNHMKEKL